MGEWKAETVDAWKQRTIGCESENKRLTAENERLNARVVQLEEYLVDSRRHVQSAAMNYKMNEHMHGKTPDWLLRMDYKAAQKDCCRLFRIIEAIEDKQRKALEELE